IFFISSRRRHTRCYRDWSSDVCSSDLAPEATVKAKIVRFGRTEALSRPAPLRTTGIPAYSFAVRSGFEHRRRRAPQGDRLGRPKIGRASCRERVEIEVDID